MMILEEQPPFPWVFLVHSADSRSKHSKPKEVRLHIQDDKILLVQLFREVQFSNTHPGRCYLRSVSLRGSSLGKGLPGIGTKIASLGTRDEELSIERFLRAFPYFSPRLYLAGAAVLWIAIGSNGSKKDFGGRGNFAGVC